MGLGTGEDWGRRLESSPALPRDLVIWRQGGTMKEIVWDKRLPGFGLRTRNGKRTWVFKYKLGNQNRRIKLGGPELSRDDARRLAEAEKGKLAKAKLGHGPDPAAERDTRRA